MKINTQFTLVNRFRRWECEDDVYHTDEIVVNRLDFEKDLNEHVQIISVRLYDETEEEASTVEQVLELFLEHCGDQNVMFTYEHTDGKWWAYVNELIPDAMIASAIRRAQQWRQSMFFYYYPGKDLILSEYRPESVLAYYKERDRLPGGLN